MFCLIREILEAAKGMECRLRTLRDIRPIYRSRRELCYFSGNNAVVLKVEYRGGVYAMRCYRDRKCYLRELYGEAFYPAEFDVGRVGLSKYIDVVLVPWVEGRSLASSVEEALGSGDDELLARLARSFDKMAVELLGVEWAHGDLTAENIIVGDDGVLHPVDLDARYIPELEGREAMELGTRAYQSPLRRACDFGAHLDDHSIALISTALHALSLEPTFTLRFPFLDGLLLDAELVSMAGYEPMQCVLNLFAEGGCFVEYRVARMLRVGGLRFEGLRSLLSFSLRERGVGCGALDLFIDGWGYAGYCDVESGEIVIPPLFDEAFDFRADEALVRVGECWFYIDANCEVLRSCF